MVPMRIGVPVANLAARGRNGLNIEPAGAHATTDTAVLHAAAAFGTVVVETPGVAPGLVASLHAVAAIPRQTAATTAATELDTDGLARCMENPQLEYGMAAG